MRSVGEDTMTLVSALIVVGVIVSMIRTVLHHPVPLAERWRIRKMSEEQLSGLMEKLETLDSEEPSPIVDDSDRIRWYVRNRLADLRNRDRRKANKAIAYVREAARTRKDGGTGAL